MQRSWIRMTILYLFLTAAAGVLMRSVAIFPISDVPYANILHAHSHLAILGWAYMVLFLLYRTYFMNHTEPQGPKLWLLYWATQLTIMGMFVSFILQGYAIYSIAFSTLHIFLSYAFAGRVWYLLKPQPQQKDKCPVSHMYVKGSLICLVISSVGPWTLAVLSARHLKDTPWFDVSVYFYLHFQYNGWLTLGLLAVLFRVLEKKAVPFKRISAAAIFWLYMGALLPSFLLSILWVEMGGLWQAAASAAGVIQWLAVILLGRLIYRVRTALRKLFSGASGLLFVLAGLALLLKSTMELGLAVPGLTDLIYESRSVVIGYLHLVLLGFVSFFGLALWIREGWLRAKGSTVWSGYVLFITGFIFNEGLLFWQGLLDWTGGGQLKLGQEALWIASILMWAGTGLILWAEFRGSGQRLT